MDLQPHTHLHFSRQRKWFPLLLGVSISIALFVPTKGWRPGYLSCTVLRTKYVASPPALDQVGRYLPT
jgi:hypothetical protein